MQEKHNRFDKHESIYLFKKHVICKLQVWIPKFAIVTENFNGRKVALPLKRLKKQ